MRRSIIAIALVVFLAPAAALSQAKSGTSGNGAVYEELNLFGEAFERIRHDAVDPVADQRLVQTAIAGMLARLDPHSVYLDETQYKALQGGVGSDAAASTGLVVTLDKGQLEVVAPRDGSPAAKADIKPGDFIYAIDKEPIYDLNLPEIEQRLHGKAGSKIALMLRRSSKLIKVTLTRVADKFPTVTRRLEGGDIGYIRLSGFDDATPADLAAAIQDLQQEAGSKLIGYVLDLRNNPGGSFDIAVKAADALIDKGDIAVVKGRKPDEVKHIAATPGDLTNGQPIVALVNGGTAREAELVAGALQDSKRAVLIGSKTFGSSAIETLIPLNGNGAIELTTARFLTPSGRPIEGKGLEPDLVVSPLKLQKVVQLDRLRESDLPGAMKNPDAPPATSASPPAGAKVPPTTTTTAAPPKGKQPTVASGDIGTSSDEQLSEAIDVLRGLAVVSGRTASAAH